MRRWRRSCSGKMAASIGIGRRIRFTIAGEDFNRGRSVHEFSREEINSSRDEDWAQDSTGLVGSGNAFGTSCGSKSIAGHLRRRDGARSAGIANGRKTPHAGGGVSEWPCLSRTASGLDLTMTAGSDRTSATGGLRHSSECDARRGNSDTLLHSPAGERLSSAGPQSLHDVGAGDVALAAVLDAECRKFLARPDLTLPEDALLALRVGTYQLLFLDRIPDACSHSSSRWSGASIRRGAGSPGW